MILILHHCRCIFPAMSSGMPEDKPLPFRSMCRQSPHLSLSDQSLPSPPLLCPSHTVTIQYFQSSHQGTLPADRTIHGGPCFGYFDCPWASCSSTWPSLTLVRWLKSYIFWGEGDVEMQSCHVESVFWVLGEWLMDTWSSPIFFFHWHQQILKWHRRLIWMKAQFWLLNSCSSKFEETSHLLI